MLITSVPNELRLKVREARSSGREIALVPTMGALHDGHASLVRIARARGCFVVMTIFVNPLQFNNPEDLKKYPRTLERDTQAAMQCGVDILFTPEVEHIYPKGSAFACRISAGSAAEVLEGPTRPGHFDGVATIVGILFNLVQPDCAVFGEKDFQQVRVIQQMVSDLHFPINIISAPIMREADGLAMSSRNVRLSPAERLRALEISRALLAARERVLEGERNAPSIIASVENRFGAPASLKVDYVSIVHRESLMSITEITSDSVLLVAVFVGEVRLIDNVALMR